MADLAPRHSLKAISVLPRPSRDGWLAFMITPESVQQEKARLRALIEAAYLDPTGQAQPIHDGVIDADLYCASADRVMWILKEPWDEEGSSGGGWCLCQDVLAKRSVRSLSHSTFHPIIYISHALKNGGMSYDDMPWVREMENPEETLRSIAFINAKKLPGVRKGAHAKTVLQWYRKGQDVIREQITAYAPDIVFGCSPHLPEILFGLNPLWASQIKTVGSADYLWHGNTLFVHVYHPGQTTIKREKYVDDAINAVAQARRERIQP